MVSVVEDFKGPRDDIERWHVSNTLMSNTNSPARNKSLNPVVVYRSPKVLGPRYVRSNWQGPGAVPQARRVQLEPENARRVGVFWHIAKPFKRDMLSSGSLRDDLPQV